jgi:hypothetical protein
MKLNYMKNFDEVIVDFNKLSHSERAEEIESVQSMYNRHCKDDMELIGKHQAQTRQVEVLLKKMKAANISVLNAL